jgi:DNA-binding Lrp family transcriptional regulator
MVYAALSSKEQTILKAFQKDGPMEVKDLVRATGIGEKAFSVYRARLLKEGVLFSPSFGRLQMSLPRFSVFLETK